MQRLGLTTDHRDQIEDLLDTWNTYTSDRVISLDEIRDLDRQLRAAAQSAAIVDDTTRHALTVLKTGATSPTALRQRRDLDRLYAQPGEPRVAVLPLFPHAKKHRREANPNGAA